MRSEQDAGRSEASFHLLSAVSPSLVFHADAEGRSLFANQRWEEITGRPPRSSIGDGWAEAVHSDDRERVFETWQRTVREGADWRDEFRFCHVDGGVTWVLGFAQPIRAADGTIEGYIGTCTDITERKAAEAALIVSNQRLEHLLKHSPSVVYTRTPKGDRAPTYVSENVEYLTGYRSSDFVDRPEFWIDNVHAEDVDELRLAQGGFGVVEYRFRHKDGRWVWISDACRVLRDETGSPVEIVGTLHDVTERKSAEAERQTLTDQLRQSQKLEAVGQLAGGVAHDFNNLLTAILGNVQHVEYLLESGQTAGRLDEARDGLRETERAAERAASLTRQLLAFSRGHMAEPRVLDLNRIVTDMETMLSRLIGEHIELSVYVAEESLPVHVDPNQVEQVIMNLVVNSRDAMPAGGRLEIRTERAARGRACRTPGDPDQAGAASIEVARLIVSDTGAGMDPEIARRIYEPFFTTKPVGQGTGLGLSTVYGIVTQAGGAIDVDSRPGRGSTFHVELPLHTGETPLVERDAVTRPSGHEVVLVCEDEQQVRHVTCQALETSGYRVLQADGPDAALELLDRRAGEPVDLLITDMVMPHISGRELARRVRSRYPRVAVLYISGYSAADPDVPEDAADRPPFLGKPFGSAELLQRVRSLLDG